MSKWGNIKQKPFRQILAYSRIFQPIQECSDISKHSQPHSGILRNYSGIFWTLCNPVIFKIWSIFRTLSYPKLWPHPEPETHSEPWNFSRNGLFHMKTIELVSNILGMITGISKTLTYSEPETYSESMDIHNARHTYSLVRHSWWSIYDLFSSSWNKYDFFNAGLIITPEVFIQCQKL